MEKHRSNDNVIKNVKINLKLKKEGINYFVKKEMINKFELISSKI